MTRMWLCVTTIWLYMTKNDQARTCADLQADKNWTIPSQSGSNILHLGQI